MRDKSSANQSRRSQASAAATRGVLAVTLAGLGIGVLPSPLSPVPAARSAAAEDKKAENKKAEAVLVIQFDAATTRFLQYSEPEIPPTPRPAPVPETRPSAVSTGRPIRIRIVNPNSFTDTYKIEAFGVSFPRVGIDKVLSFIPGIGEFISDRALPGENFVAQGDIERVRDFAEFSKAAKAFIQAQKDLELALPKRAEFIEWRSYKEKLDRRVATASTSPTNTPASLTANAIISNATIRAAVGYEMNQWTNQSLNIALAQDNPYDDLSDDNVARFRFLADELRSGADKKINDIQTRLDAYDAAKASLEAEYNAIKPELDDDVTAARKKEDPNAIRAATSKQQAAARIQEQAKGDKTGTRATKAVEFVEKAITDSVDPAILLVKKVMNKRFAPTYLEKSIKAQDDRLDFKVTVTTKAGETTPAAAGTGGKEAAASDSDRGGARNSEAAPASAGNGGTSTTLIDAPGDFGSNTYPYSLPVSKRWVLDASAGLVVTFTGREQFAPRKEITASGQSQKVVRRTGRDDAEGDLGLLVHYYQTNPNGWAFGPTFGIVPNGTNQIKSYLAGFSFIRGQENRLVLTVGAAIGDTEKLNGFSVGDVVPADRENMLTRRAQQVRPFASLTFQITRF